MTAGVASAPVAMSSRQIRGKCLMIFIRLLLVGVEMNPGPTRRVTHPINAMVHGTISLVPCMHACWYTRLLRFIAPSKTNDWTS